MEYSEPGLVFFDAVFGADVENLITGLTKTGKKGDIGSNVACSAAAGEYDTFHVI